VNSLHERSWITGIGLATAPPHEVGVSSGYRLGDTDFGGVPRGFSVLSFPPLSVGSGHFSPTSEQSHPWSLITPPPRTSRAAGKRQGRKRDRKVQQVLAAVKQRSPTPPPASQPPRTCACAARYLSARAVIDGLGGAGFLSLSETRSTHRTGVHPSHHIFKLRGTSKPHTTHVLQFDVQRARARVRVI